MPAAWRLHRCLLKGAAVAALLVGLMVLAWLPVLRILSQPGADQVWESFGIAESCVANPARLGWLPSPQFEVGQGLFTHSLPGQALLWSACRLSLSTALQPLQAFLLLGQCLTLLLSAVACRWMGLGPVPSALTAFLLATAPCAFSRVGHLGLSILLPVVPTLVGCVQLRRLLVSESEALDAIGLGALVCAASVPFQEYYVVFSLLILLTCFGLQLLIMSSQSLRLKPLRDALVRGALFMAGYLSLLVLLFLPKLLVAGGDGVPLLWSAPRLAAEQFRYGLLPLTWVIPSPWVPAALEILRRGGINTATESYFWSTGSLLIPLGWIVALRRLFQVPLSASISQASIRFTDVDRRFLALLLLLVTALGLLCMTMGGLGTLFAAGVTPVLRSLNRYTVFVYGSAVLYLMAELDLWLGHRERNC